MKKKSKGKLKYRVGHVALRALALAPIGCAVAGLGGTVVGFVGSLVSVAKEETIINNIAKIVNSNEDFKAKQREDIKNLEDAYVEGKIDDKELEEGLKNIKSPKYMLNYAATVPEYKDMYNKYEEVVKLKHNWEKAAGIAASGVLVGAAGIWPAEKADKKAEELEYKMHYTPSKEPELTYENPLL